MNKSIDGTADDEDEGVPTDQAIRAGLELLKVSVPLRLQSLGGILSIMLRGRMARRFGFSIKWV